METAHTGVSPMGTGPTDQGHMQVNPFREDPTDTDHMIPKEMGVNPTHQDLTDTGPTGRDLLMTMDKITRVRGDHELWMKMMTITWREVITSTATLSNQ